MDQVAAFTALSLLLFLAVFQLLLVTGKPFGRFAWGGKYAVLPNKLRYGSLVSVVLYAVFATIILDSAGIADLFINKSIPEIGLKIITGYFFVGILVNLASRSKSERALMTPVAAMLFVSCLVIFLN